MENGKRIAFQKAMPRKTLWSGLSIVGLVVAALFALEVGWRGGSLAGNWNHKDTRPSTTDLSSHDIATSEVRAAAAAPVASRDAVGPDKKEAREAATQPDAKNESMAQIELLVVDEDSRRPIEGARAGLWHHERNPESWSIGSDEMTAHTNERGFAIVTLPALEAAKLHVERPEWQKGAVVNLDLVPLVAGQTREVRVSLPTPREVVFWGRVVSAESDSPVGEAAISVHDGSETKSGERWVPTMAQASAKSDAQGYFTVSAPSYGNHWFRVDKPQFGTMVMRIRPGFEAPEKAFKIRLDHGATLRVLVSAFDGNGLANAGVVMFTESYRVEASGEDQIFTAIEWRGATDERGICVFDGLPGGVPLDVEVHAIGRIKKPIGRLETVAGETKEWRCMIGGDACLRGRVLDQDAHPVVNRDLWLLPLRSPLDFDRKVFIAMDGCNAIAKATTDDRGVFRINDVAPGDYWLGPAAKSLKKPSPRAICPSTTAVTMPASGDVDITIHVWRGLYIDGHVVSPAGLGIRGIHIDAFGEDGASTDGVESGEGGAFKLGPLTPGSYTVRAFVFAGEFAAGEPIEASPGNGVVTIRLKAGGSVSGRVVDGESLQLVRAMVELSSTDLDRGARRLKQSMDGNFRIGGLMEGNYVLTATTGDAKVGIATGLFIAAEQDVAGVEIRVVPAARLRVRANANDRPTTFEVLLDGRLIHIDGIDLTTGLSSDFLVPAGNLKIRFRTASDVFKDVDVSIAAGETKEISN
jgi:hypothetical protein